MSEPTPMVQDPFNCPKCWAHDYGLFAASMVGCPHCLQAELTASRAAEQKLREEVERLRADKDEAYRERNNVVAAFARLFPSGIRKTEIEGWNPEWHGCVYIDLPNGQISYHYHDNQAQLFADLPAYTKEWDGHDKATVHMRLATFNVLRDERAAQAEARAEALRVDAERYRWLRENHCEIGWSGNYECVEVSFRLNADGFQDLDGAIDAARKP